jgi:hypothetical protein
MHSDLKSIRHAAIETGAVVSANTGISIPSTELVLVLHGVTNLDESAVVSAFPLNAGIEEFVLLCLVGNGTATAIAIDLTQPEASEFMARGVRHGFAIFVDDGTEGSNRLVRLSTGLPSDLAKLEAMWRYQSMQKHRESSKTFIRFLGTAGDKIGQALATAELDAGRDPVDPDSVHCYVVINENHRRHLGSKTVGDVVVAHKASIQQVAHELRDALIAIERMAGGGSRKQTHRIKVAIP